MLFTQRFNNDHGYGVHIRIMDPSRPLVFCFDNMASARKGLDRNGWGVDFVSKRGVNVVSFLETQGGRQYSHPSFAKMMTDVDEILGQWTFPRRIGYATSMGGYVALAYAERLRLDTVACVSPIAPQNGRGADWQRRFVNFDCRDWRAPWTPGVLAYLQSIRVIIMVDPLKDLDVLHARSIPSVWCRVPGMGHALEAWTQPLKLMPYFFDYALSEHDDPPRRHQFHVLARGRRSTARYYTWLLSDENVHRTPRRDVVIAYNGMQWAQHASNEDRGAVQNAALASLGQEKFASIMKDMDTSIWKRWKSKMYSMFASKPRGFGQ